MSQQTNQDINYKDTLKLPQTTFKMKAGAATREPEIEAFWDEQQVYFKAQAARDKNRKFVLHDGPPYLSSDKIHIGTALNKILKDIVTRYKYQRGYYAPYIPGYDGHGLPIENAVVKSIKGGRAALSESELRKKCREFGDKNLIGQEANFKRLGVWGDWAHPYKTPDAHYEATQIQCFAQMYDKGYVYKGLKPVYWCSSCETALADAEVEYDNHTSHSIYVKFAITDADNDLLTDASVVIWTTTPWTIPANLAQSVHPDFTYVVLETQHGKLVLAKDLAESFVKAAGIDGPELLGEVRGTDLEGLKTQHPFVERLSPVLLGNHVTLEAGTGVVHTAPGHGMEDYVICQQYDREQFKDNPIGIVSPLNNRGVFDDLDWLPEQLRGQHYSKGNAVVIDLLKEKGALLGHGELEHSYPHCWRCHKPVVYRATEQWFFKVDAFRQSALDAIKDVGWIPERGESRITSMVEGRTDWCISRQRVWGVPIPVFFCQSCHTPLINDQTTERVHQLFCEKTSDAWWDMSAEEILEGKFDCGHCGGKTFDKEMDIMDVWFDSGISHTAVVEDRRDELGDLPVELYLEGSDQHRGWFQSALLTSVMLNGKAPYQTVLTHGFVLDENGRKMSKSLGNVVDPNDIIKQYGADVLRLWVASVDYSVDVRIGNEIVKQLTEVYKKIRNTVRFMLGNLAGFDPDAHAVPYEKLSDLDKYILHELQDVVGTLTTAFDQYQFHKYYQVLQNFCVTELSSLYFDVAKDILYCDPENGERRRAMQTVLYDLLTTLLPMLVPVMPHMAEDIWEHLPENQKPKYGFDAPPLSITMAPWPEANVAHVLNDEAINKAQHLLETRERVNGGLEVKRSEEVIGSSLGARVWLSEERLAALGVSNPADLAALFLTSQVESGPKDSPPGDLWKLNGSDPEALLESAGVGLGPAKGDKCDRCWRFQESVGTFADHPKLCTRCHDAVTTYESTPVT